MLSKLAKLCYEEKDLHRYNESICMAAELFLAPSKLSLPHPQIAVEYKSYNFREYINESFFNEKQILTSGDAITWISNTI